MGKSSSVSCFKFVGCGDPDSVDGDDVPAAEINDSSDKRKWSFRKRSARSRVLSNSATLQTPIGNNAGFESGLADFQKQASCTNIDSHLAKVVSPAEEESAAEEKIAGDVTLDESTVITIQTAVRGFLAKKALVKHKHIILLQAAIRGHIVRKVAVGSLRCVQAIVKMQVLIREHRDRLLLQSSSSDGNDEKLDKKSLKGLVNLVSRPLETYASIEELLSKRFARQLLESYPRSKTINIKCEPLKSDSAWKWMERWMSISSIGRNHSPCSQNIVGNPGEKCPEQPEDQFEDGFSRKDSRQSRETELSNEEVFVPSEVGSAISHGMHNFVSNHDIKRPYPVTTCIENKCVDMSDFLPETEHQLEDDISHTDNIPSTEMESSNEEPVVPSERGSVISHGMNSFESNNDIERPCSVTVCMENKCDDMSDSFPDHTKESSNASKTEPNSYTNSAEMCEQDMDSVDSHLGGSETTGKNVPFGSRKASNPAFLAAKSKFQELSLTGNSAKPVGLSKQDARLEPSADAVSMVMSLRTRETLSATASLLQAPSQVEVADPESVTELPISSSLDLLDGPVTDNSSSGKETAVLEDKDEYSVENHISSGADTNVQSKILHGPVIDASSVEKETSVLEDKDEYTKNHISSVVDTKVESPMLDEDLSRSKPFLEERRENIGHDESKDACSAMAVDSSQAYENNVSVEVTIQMQTDTSHEPSTLSPAASPRSYMTVTDCQGTPSSQVSVNPRKSSGKNVANHKRKSLSSGKGYHSVSKHDSGAKTDSEQAPKENKTGKRRNSLGSARTDNGNQEPRDSSSSNSLPSYMQATESAKAKAIATNSPRSSPDVLDKDFHIKKRHSLPGGNTKHGSSCPQQSTSQALQDAKANGVHSPQERKWKR